MGPLEQLLIALGSKNIKPNYDESYQPSEMLPKKPETLPFYPQQRYFDEKLAPEQYPVGSLEALVRAQKLAESEGVIPKELGKYVLPNMISEGWANYGLKSPNYDYPVSKGREERFKKLGFNVQTDAPDVGLTDIYRYPGDPKNGYVLDANLANPVTGDRNAQARYAMAFLAEKLASAKGDVDKAIKKWNGKGKAVETVTMMDGTTKKVNANADNHLRKVKKAYELLNHPKNEELVNYYNYLMSQE